MKKGQVAKLLFFLLLPVLYTSILEMGLEPPSGTLPEKHKSFEAGILSLGALDGSKQNQRQSIRVNSTGNTIVSAGNTLEALDDHYRSDINAPLEVDEPGLLANDLIPIGAKATVILVKPPRNGTLSLRPDGSFSYTADLHFSGIDRFTYRLEDGIRKSEIATASISVPEVTPKTEQVTISAESFTGPRIAAITDYTDTADGIPLYWEKAYYQDLDIAGTTPLEIPFGLSLPSGYDPEGTTLYPLVIALHGAGARSNWIASDPDPDSRDHSLVDAALKAPTAKFFAKAAQAEPPYYSFVLVPQVPTTSSLWVGTGPDAPYTQTDTPDNTYSQYMHLLENLIVFMSDGAKGTWDILARQPSLLAGGIAGAGTGPENRLTELHQTPIWAIHGILDDTVPNALPSENQPLGSGSLGILSLLDPSFDNTSSTLLTHKDDPALSGDDPFPSDVLVYSEFDETFSHYDVAVYWTSMTSGTLPWLFAQTSSGNFSPTADAGPDQSVSDSDGNGSESVTLDGSGSSDPDGTIASYLWEEGATQIATGAAPNVTLAVGTHTITLTVTDDGNATGNDTVVVTVNADGSSGGSSTATSRVSAGSDDAEEFESDSTMYLTSSDLELVFDTSNTGNQSIGMRFTSVDVPQGATIDSAYIQFQVDESTSETTNLTIQGEATDNAATFTTATGNISSRPRTGAAVAWAPPPWQTVGEAGPDQRTSDISAVVQEIVDRLGWASGNALVFFITGSGKRVAESYNGSPAGAPLLNVVWSTASPSQAPVVYSFAPSSGEPETVVTVTGEHFSGAIGVSINGTPAVFQVLSDSELQAIVPTGATSGLIEVVSDVGSGFSSDSYTVVPSALVLVGAGDIAGCEWEDDEATSSLLDSIPGIVLTFGDHAYEDGTPAQFDSCYDPSWGRYRMRTRPSPGNHDYRTAGAAAYYDYFGVAAGDASQGYYSYDVGDWHIVALNSECAEVGGCEADSPQGQWLQADLAAHPSDCTLAYWHRPLFNSGAHDNEPAVQDFWEILYAAGADIVLNGHSHDYERFAPQTPNGISDPAGIREFVVGTGGAPFQEWGTTKPNSEIRNATTHGVLKLSLHPGSYDWQFVPVAGQSFTDSGTGMCFSGDPRTIVTSRVAAGSDDAEEFESGGFMYLDSSDLELAFDTANTGNQHVGIRFDSIDVPQGATIDNAYIQFTADEANSGATSLTIWGQAADDPATFTSADYNVSSRIPTTASVTWNPADWNTLGASGTDQRTPQLKNVVQEIVDQAGWARNNAMVFIITGSGERTAESSMKAPLGRRPTWSSNTTPAEPSISPR